MLDSLNHCLVWWLMTRWIYMSYLILINWLNIYIYMSSYGYLWDILQHAWAYYYVLACKNTILYNLHSFFYYSIALYKIVLYFNLWLAMHWILAPEPSSPKLCVPLIEDLISSQEFVDAEFPVTWIRQKLLVNNNQIQQVIYSRIYN